MNLRSSSIVGCAFTVGILQCVTAPGANGADSPGPARTKTELPVSQIVLYSSGVGFFERTGEVEGRTDVELRFRTEEINDLLKSMVVQDFSGGNVSTVTYDSRDPITKTLKSFGLDLTDNPSQGDLLNQARGERVEIFWPGKLAGTIVGVEKKQEPAGENKTVEREYLNLLTDDGLQSIPLSQVQKVKVLNERLATELRQALEVLARGHDTQKKTVGIGFDGNGKRKVSVGYIAQTPVWKTSYRLVLNEKEKSLLQGWAIVENTSDEDWNSVNVSLVSGQPISFVMDLYQPLYATRPVVQQEQRFTLAPQTYGEAMDLGKPLEEKLERSKTANRADALIQPSAPLGAMAAGGFGRVNLRAEVANQPETQKLGFMLDNLSTSIATAAQGAQAGELFQYTIQTPVNLARQKSAMLPIVNDPVAGEKLSIYNQKIQAKYPLNGFRLKNITSLNLMQGPITVFDGNSYAGDARIDDIAPGQERLLSYGVDAKVEVEPQSSSEPTNLLAVKIRKGTMILTRKAAEEHTYNVRNRDQKAKTVLIEHPFRVDWQLIKPKGTPERTREVYRFPVRVEPSKTEKLVVQEERQFDERVALSNLPDDTILLYTRSQKTSPKVQEALQHVLSLRDRVSQTSANRARKEQLRTEISQEQTRIRENMQRLNQTSDLYQRYVKKLDQQETELENLRQEIEQLKNTETKQQQDLNDYLNGLELD